MSSSNDSPYGSISGLALDVIIVVPSPSCRHSSRSQGRVSSPKRDPTHDLGVIASSDFYVTFPSSVHAAVSANSDGGLNTSSVTKLKRWTSSFLYNTPSSSPRINESSARHEESVKGVESDHSIDYSIGPKTHQMSPNNNPDNTSSATPQRGNIQIHINGRPIRDFEMNLTVNNSNESVSKFVIGNGLRPPTESLEMLVDEAILNYGRNLIRYILFNDKKEKIASAEAFLYLWSARDSVIVCDIDGTITKSDVRGVLDTVVQDNFKHIHRGVCKFFNKLINAFEMNRYEEESSSGGQIRFFYLSSRPISYISQTRKLLVGLSQEDEEMRDVYGLPPGPIMCHRGSLSTVLHSELVAKNVYEFKADVLARQIVLPFVAAIGNSVKHKFGGESFDDQSDNLWRSESDLSELTINAADDRLFLAGFGNKVTDAKAYELAGIDRKDIYIINKESVIQCLKSDGLKRSSIGHSFNINTSTISCDTDMSDFCCGIETSDNNLSREAKCNNVVDCKAPLSDTMEEEELDFSPPTLVVQPTKSSRSMRKIKQAKQTIRAFSLKKSFASFRSEDSFGEAFFGYDDPKLLLVVGERMKKPQAEIG